MTGETPVTASEEHGSAASHAPGDVVRVAARAFERDRYLSALLAPRHVRGDLLALAAFAGEVWRIPAIVSETMMGEIRLQWWRDAIDNAAADTTGHPIADALAVAITRHRLPAPLLHGIVDAVGARLADQPFADLAALTGNLEKLDGALFSLACRILGGASPEPPLLAEAGVAYGLARLLIEAPAELAQGRALLPADMMRAHGCSPADAHNAAAAPAWRRLADALAAIARRRMSEFAPSYQRASADIRRAALPVALVRPYLRASERTDIASLEVCDISPLTRVWRLWLAHRFAAL